MTNEAAWIGEPKANVEIGPAQMYTPGSEDVLVEVESIEFNAINAKIQKFCTVAISYPAILGVAFAGVVEEVSSAVVSVKEGDRVVWSWTSTDPHFPVRSPIVLIYGGSPSCGRYATKYASNAGYEVVRTPSPEHRKVVEEHNPSYIINHTLPHEKLVSELESHGPYDAGFDAIGTPPVTAVLVSMSGDKGGIYQTTLPPMGGEPIPANVERIFASYTALLAQEGNEDIRRWFFEESVPKGLANGQIIPSSIIKKEDGLRSVQEVLDGILTVSRRRFVVNPQD